VEAAVDAELIDLRFEFFAEWAFTKDDEMDVRAMFEESGGGGDEVLLAFMPDERGDVSDEGSFFGDAEFRRERSMLL